MHERLSYQGNEKPLTCTTASVLHNTYVADQRQMSFKHWSLCYSIKPENCHIDAEPYLCKLWRVMHPRRTTEW